MQIRPIPFTFTGLQSRRCIFNESVSQIVADNCRFPGFLKFSQPDSRSDDLSNSSKCDKYKKHLLTLAQCMMKIWILDRSYSRDSSFAALAIVICYPYLISRCVSTNHDQFRKGAHVTDRSTYNLRYDGSIHAAGARVGSMPRQHENRNSSRFWCVPLRGSFAAASLLQQNCGATTRAHRYSAAWSAIGLCPSIRSIMHIARLWKLHTATRRIHWILRMPERLLERSGHRCISDSNLRYVAGSLSEIFFLLPRDKSRHSWGGVAL